MSHTDLHQVHGMLPPISQAHYMSHTDLHQVHGKLPPISQAHYMSHTDLHQVHGKASSHLSGTTCHTLTFTKFMGMLPPISQAHYMLHTEQMWKAMEEEKKSNLSAAAAHLKKDDVPDEILTVTDM